MVVDVAKKWKIWRPKLPLQLMRVESHIVDRILAESSIKDMEGESAFAAGDVTESHIVNQILDLEKVTRHLDSIKEYVIARFKDQQLTCSTPPPPPPPPAASSRPASSMVGFDEYLVHLLDKLTGQQSSQQVIPIIGMGGVGKTTLARNAFDNLLIEQHFDVCAWATISQNYSAREILLQLLPSQESSTSLVDLSEQKLGEKLHKCLFSRRYLIILDDMWSVDVWDEIKFFFPDNNNGSRIVVTTRLLNVALLLNSSYITVKLLDEDKSWNLFCQESFGKEGCPSELEEVGKKICENCKGLPLSIIVIGGFLQRSSKSREDWEGVARDTYSILNSEGGNQCMNIISLSYNHLMAHLKPCFLYMGVFAEDDVIFVSRLVKLWVAEGFLRANDAQSLEEVAEGYLEDLVDRNLILVNEWGKNGKIKSCSIHDLIRELCLSVAEKENFLCIMKLVDTPRAINRERRIVIHDERMSSREVSYDLGSASLVRSLTCKGRTVFNFRLLKVLNVVDKIRHTRFLEDDLSCVNLRSLDHRFVGESRPDHQSLYFPKKISSLWNLQMVSIRRYRRQIVATSELWEMVQLKHLQVDDLYIPDPRGDRVDLVLPNLVTLWRPMNLRLSNEVCKTIPNIKKLRLVYSEFPQGCDAASYYRPQNLGRFHKLESFTLRFTALQLQWRHMVLNMTFPSSLKKLSLRGGNLHWEDLEVIGSLPNLEDLKLLAFWMTGSEWSLSEEGFRSLKFLRIFWSHLSVWNADHFHFPVLEKLVLTSLDSLDEIPSGIGEIPTLKSICLFQCSLSSALSAVKILEEQESYGNDDLRVEVGFHIHNNNEAERFREMVEEYGFTSNNLHIKRAKWY